jgi:hypothetical protein
MIPGISAVMGLAVSGAKAPSVVQRVNGNRGASRGTSSTLTWSSTTAGNLIIIEFYCETNGAGPTTPAGYTAWPSGNKTSGGDLQMTVFYKIASAGETGVTISHGNNETTWTVREVAAPKQTIDFGTPVAATTTTPDPPAVTPAAGSGAYLIVAGASYEINGASQAISAYPAGYSNGTNSLGAGSGNTVSGASAEKAIVGTTENPGTLTLASNNISIAYTYAVS